MQNGTGGWKSGALSPKNDHLGVCWAVCPSSRTPAAKAAWERTNPREKIPPRDSPEYRRAFYRHFKETRPSHQDWHGEHAWERFDDDVPEGNAEDGYSKAYLEGFRRPSVMDDFWDGYWQGPPPDPDAPPRPLLGKGPRSDAAWLIRYAAEQEERRRSALWRG